MRRVLLAAFVFALGLITGSVTTRPAHAGKPCTVPKEWGQLRAMNDGPGGPLLAFEAADGTVRIIPSNCGSPAKPAWQVGRE